MNKIIEGQVDIKKDYFLLTYGSVRVDNPVLIEVVLVGKVDDHEFVYRFSDEATDEIKRIVLHELEYYLVKHGPNSVMNDGWEYAKYHATTSSNLYSDIHWNFYQIYT